MLDIFLTSKILGPLKSEALVLSLFSLMVNPRLAALQKNARWNRSAVRKRLPTPGVNDGRSEGRIAPTPGKPNIKTGPPLSLAYIPF